MNEVDEPATRQSPPPSAPAPGHLRWDTSGLQSHRCTLATASATPMEIILNFAAKRGSDFPGGEVGIELLQRISLTPLTAKNLMATLERVIADHDNALRGR